MSSRRKDEPQSSNDLLWGAEAIADHIGRSKRQTYYLIEIEAIPVKHLGPRTIVGSRSEIDASLKNHPD